MKSVQDLIQRLQEAQKVVDLLAETLAQQLEALNKNDLDFFNKTIQSQNSRQEELLELETAIRNEQEKVRQALGLPEYTLAQVVAVLPSDLATQLSTNQKELKSKLERLKQNNDLNNMIVKQNLAYTQKMLQMLAKFKDQGSSQTYSEQGQLKQDQNNVLLNRQV